MTDYNPNSSNAEFINQKSPALPVQATDNGPLLALLRHVKVTKKNPAHFHFFSFHFHFVLLLFFFMFVFLMGSFSFFFFFFSFSFHDFLFFLVSVFPHFHFRFLFNVSFLLLIFGCCCFFLWGRGGREGDVCGSCFYFYFPYCPDSHFDIVFASSFTSFTGHHVNVIIISSFVM